MTVKIYPSVASGTVSAPPSKSAAHRALICAALTDGCCVNNIAYSQDIKATLGCLQALGAKIEKNGDAVFLGSLSPENIQDSALLDCFESGSTLRFMLPLCMLAGKEITLCGSERLLSRPLSVYEDICRKDGIDFSNDGKAVRVCGRLKGGEYSVPGDISSQFITGLLFALPLCEKDSVLTVTGSFESASYVDITLSMLSRFTIDIKRDGNVFYIKGGQRYTGCDHTVEGDCSNAAFLDGFNLLGGSVTVEGLSPDTLQGDRVYKDMFGRLEKENTPCFDLSDCPDLAPVMFALAAAKGGAEFTGTKRLKIKESDRAAAMQQELAKFSIEAVVGDNTVSIKCGKITAPRQTLCGHNDHRIVMALALLCSLTGGEIEGAEAVSKSFPDFFTKIELLGIGLEQNGTLQ